MSKNVNVVILNAGSGYRIKSYGPKCLLKLNNGESILERQLRLIFKKYRNAKIFQSVGFESYKIQKNKNIKKYNIEYTENTSFDSTNNLFSLKQVLVNNNILDCFVLFGDVVFDEEHFPDLPNQSTVFSSQNHRENKIGINGNNGFASYMIWGLETSWSEILYLDKDLVSYIKKFQYSDNAYILEVLNDYMDVGQIKLEAFGSDIIDIDLLSDLDIANAKFSIGKIHN